MRCCSGRNRAGCRTWCCARLGERQQLRLPMRPGQRSLNLSNAVAVACSKPGGNSGYAGAG
jgi:tRNA (cytidine/uridine-2'-O-)-methyltransferase